MHKMVGQLENKPIQFLSYHIAFDSKFQSTTENSLGIGIH